MNRRGHIGTLLLVIGALILVVSALYVMTRFGDDVSRVRSEMRSLSGKSSAVHENVLIDVEKIVNDAFVLSKDKLANFGDSEFEKLFNKSLKNLAGQERVSGLNMNVYARIALGNYSLNFDSVSGKYDLVVYDVFEQTNVENNNMRYVYNLEILFDKDHVISVKGF